MPAAGRLRGFVGLRAAARQGRALDEVMRHPFICHKQGSLTFEFLESMCKARGVDFAPAMEPDTTGLVLDLARHGLGIGFLPEVAAKRPWPPGRCSPCGSRRSCRRAASACWNTTAIP